MSELYSIRARFTGVMTCVPLPRKNGMPDCRDDRPRGSRASNLARHSAAPERLSAMTGQRSWQHQRQERATEGFPPHRRFRPGNGLVIDPALFRASPEVSGAYVLVPTQRKLGLQNKPQGKHAPARRKPANKAQACR
jgi:hypothetical protein